MSINIFSVFWAFYIILIIIAFLKFFKAKTPSSKELIANVDDKKYDHFENEDNTQNIENATNATNGAEKNPKKNPKKNVVGSPKTRDKLEKSEKIALITIIQKADKIADIGKYSHCEIIDDTSVIHYFESAMTSYVGWKWAVTLSLLNENDDPSVLECNLVSGPDSIKVPAWIPFKDRINPSDISEIDSLPYEENDIRLEEFISRFKNENKSFENIAVERERTLNAFGKAQLSARWYEGNHGPHTASTRIAKENCMSCGFYVPLSGDLGQIFGVCCNGWSRDDGRVVSTDHGCGMHSETDIKAPKRWKSSEFVVDQINTIDIEKTSENNNEENTSLENINANVDENVDAKVLNENVLNNKTLDKKSNQ